MLRLAAESERRKEAVADLNSIADDTGALRLQQVRGVWVYVSGRVWIQFT